MNPSAAGWIKKLLNTLALDNASIDVSLHDTYNALRDCGFIYGSNVLVVNDYVSDEGLTNEERCKLNFFFALLSAHNESKIKADFADSVIQFYTQINEYKTSIFDEILGGKNTLTTLENIIHKRIQIDSNAITKNFNYFVTNALLFIDILAYQHFLEAQVISEDFLKKIETSIETLVVKMLNVKAEKTEYDLSLLKLFESSMRYQDHKLIDYENVIAIVDNDLEAQYLLDISCMSTWSDARIDPNELEYLSKLGTDLGLQMSTIETSIASIYDFFTTHKNSIALLSSKNVVQSFYDNSSKLVSKLISRNGKRLQKELKESKDLMKLLSQSTIRDLSSEEQKKMQQQLLDVFKTIPSLAIFILPGGALLLPLVVKFIPKLLPSAFDDNRIEDDQ